MELAAQIESQGYALVGGVLSEASAAVLRSQMGSVIPKGRRAGSRRLLAEPEIRCLATSGRAIEIARAVLGDGTRAVRGILFDKQPAANWSLPYHQDRAIAVSERLELPGFIGWSVKEGVPHVLPPASVMEQMLAIRIHLDDCPPDNAPLRVSPGTHRLGIVAKSDVPAIVREYGEVVCTCSAGDALVMRPLLLHASAAATAPGHRRVLHIEYSGADLPGGLEWFEDV